MLKIDVMSDAETGIWQDYVTSHPSARPMHDAAWYGILGDAFAVERYFLIARDSSSTVQGVAPFYLSRSALVGAHLASLDDGMLVSDEEAQDQLLAAAVAYRDRLRLKYVLLRTADPVRPRINADTTRATVRRVIQTGVGEEQLFSSLSSYARRDVRRAAKRGYSVSNDDSLQALDTVFYDEYARQMHELGTPVMTRAMMRSMRERLGSSGMRLYLLHHETRVVGGLVCITARGRWTALYAAVRPQCMADYANYLLYWHALSQAAGERVPEMDLGRNTPGAGPHTFKQKWHGSDCYADHLYFARSGVSMDSLGNLYEGTTLKQRLWMKLPLPVANTFGPMLRKSLPFG